MIASTLSNPRHSSKERRNWSNRPVVVGVDHSGVGAVDLRVPGGQHVPCQQLILRVATARNGTRSQASRETQPLASVKKRERVPSRARQVAASSGTSGAARRTTRRAHAGPSRSPRVVPGSAQKRDRPRRSPGSHRADRASQRSSAGTASWVSRATCAPDARATREVARTAVRTAPGTSMTPRRGDGRLSRPVGRARVGHEQLDAADRAAARPRTPAPPRAAAAVAHGNGDGDGVSHLGAASCGRPASAAGPSDATRRSCRR